jgi:DNA-binding MarR family transcriptional regulator
MRSKKNNEEALSVLRAVLALGRRLRSERPVGGITLSAISILATLSRFGPVVSKQLAEAELLEPQSLTRLLAELEKRGLVTRARGELDRREMRIALTASGQALLTDDLRLRHSWLAKAMAAALSAREQHLLLSAASCIFKLAQYEPGEDG